MHTPQDFYDLQSERHTEKERLRFLNMLSWGQVRRSYGLEITSEPVMREKRGRKIVFWFRSDGNGTVADLAVVLRNKGAPVELVWDENEGLIGICIDRSALVS